MNVLEEGFSHTQPKKNTQKSTKSNKTDFKQLSLLLFLYTTIKNTLNNGLNSNNKQRAKKVGSKAAAASKQASKQLHELQLRAIKHHQQQ